MDKKNTTKTNERFALDLQADNLSALPEPSQPLLDQLISYLRTQGGAQDMDMAMALEAQGWAALTAAQIQLLVQQLRHVAQPHEAQVAQVVGANASVTDAGNLTGAALTPSEASAAPAPSGQAREGAVAFNAQEVISRLGSILPTPSSESAPSQSRFNAESNAPALGASLINALTSGSMPSVSGNTVLAANAGAQVSVAQPGTPALQVPITAPGAAVLPTLDAGAQSLAGTSGTSTSSNTVSRMPAQSSLGGNAAGVNNAAVLVPYVVQQVSTNGTLASAPVVQGSTDTGNTRTTTSYVQPASAEVVGGTVAITQPSKPAAPAAPVAEAPPNPFGDVTLQFDTSMIGTSDPLAGGDGSNLILPRQIHEGTSPSGVTPVRLMVTRVNPLMPDDIPFVIKGLNGRDDVVSVMAQAGIVLEVGPDGTLYGKVHFEAGQFNQALTINIRQDATVEVLETMRVNLEEGLFGKLLTGNHDLALNIINDDFATVSVQANAPLYDGPGANDTLPQVVEGTDSNSAYTEVSFTVTRTVPTNHGAETSGGVPLLADTIDWSLVLTGAGNISAADIHASDRSGQIQFAAGEMSRVITIRVLKDSLREDSAENLTLQLSAAHATNSQLGTDTATTRIADDDGIVSIARATGQAASEDEGSDNADAPHTLTFTVTRTNSLMADTFAYSIDGITQDDLLNGSITGNTVSFAAGETSKTITVVLRQDFNVEADENVTVTLANGTYAQVDPAHDSASVQVTNDDMVRVSVAADLAQVVEGTDDDGYVEVTFTVTRTRPDFHNQDIPLPADEFDWLIDFPSQGLSSDDIHPDDLGGPVSFAEGATSAQITVRVRKDLSLIHISEPTRH